MSAWMRVVLGVTVFAIVIVGLGRCTGHDRSLLPGNMPGYGSRGP